MSCVTDNIRANPNVFASSFRGVLMANIDTDYAEQLHVQGLQPYSQSIQIHSEEQNKDMLIWTVNTLNETARHEIIDRMMGEPFSGFYLKRIDKGFSITNKVLAEKPINQLTKELYKGDVDRKMRIEFLTPTAFGSSGSYVFVPDLIFIIRNLMQKFALASQMEEEVDTDMLDTIVKHTRLLSYRLRSLRFTVDSTTIPGFVGHIDIKVNGAQTIANYVAMLLRFAEYSGVGIKTSMGMGAVAVTIQAAEKEGRN
jgi:CRISPR-associated endoribonuclease Cas6